MNHQIDHPLLGDFSIVYLNFVGLCERRGRGYQEQHHYTGPPLTIERLHVFASHVTGI
jgi:hypothetical protein